MPNKKKLNKNQRKKLKEQKRVEKLPFVSICTPTFNRRPFIPYMIKCFESQDYPRDKMEWIIIDDGTDKIEDLVKDITCVKYFKYDTKMSLGRKRNLMHSKTKGDFIVYMDDDDFYPPDRVSHAVDVLQKNPKALCAGSSEIYIWFKHIQKMYQFGPYGPNHATAGTFAFRRQMILESSYEDDAALAEEKQFLKGYTVPFVQLDPMKTILVFSHEHNTFDKRKLLVNPNSKVTKVSSKTVDMFIKDKDMKDFYMNRVSELLKDYEPGDPKHKPDVLIQTKLIQERREKMQQEQKQKMIQMMKQNGITGNDLGGKGAITMQKDGKDTVLSNEEVIEVLKQQQTQIVELQIAVQQALKEKSELTHENTKLKQTIQELKQTIQELKGEEESKEESKENSDKIEKQYTKTTVIDI